MRIIKMSLAAGFGQGGDVLHEKTGLQAKAEGEELRLRIESKGARWTIVLSKEEIQEVQAALKSN